MRVGNALLVAGVITIFAALSGPSLASDAGRTDPADVVAAEDLAGEGAAGDVSQPADPAATEEANRTPDDVATEEATADEPEPAGGNGERKGGDGHGGRDRKSGGGGAQKEPRADVGVEMKNIAFKPKTVHIDPGDEVTWTNRDTAQHDAVGQGSADFDTDLLEKGESASVPFNDEGTFDYICTVHPVMKGKVVVGSGGGSGGSGGTSSGGTGGTSSGTGTGSTFPSGSSGSGSTFPSSGGSSSGGGSLPNTGGVELPLLIFGASLLVFGLAARAFHEYWIWR